MNEKNDFSFAWNWLNERPQKWYIYSIISLSSWNIAFLSGIFEKMGWEYFFIIHSMGIISNSLLFVSISILFYAVFLKLSIIAYSSIEEVLLLLGGIGFFARITTRPWVLKILIIVVIFVAVSSSVYFLNWWGGTRYGLVRGDEYGILFSLSLISIFMMLSLLVMFVALENAVFKRGLIGFIVVFALVSMNLFGKLWVVYVRSESNPVAIYQKNKKLKDVRILFPAGEGLLVFMEGKAKPVYLAWSSIERMGTNVEEFDKATSSDKPSANKKTDK